jgi:hypothetical protein
VAVDRAGDETTEQAERGRSLQPLLHAILGVVLKATLKAMARPQAFATVMPPMTIGIACDLVQAFNVAFNTNPTIAP